MLGHVLAWLPAVAGAVGGLGLLGFLLTPWGLAVPVVAATFLAGIAHRVTTPLVRALLLAAAVVLVLTLTYRAGQRSERGNTAAAVTRAVAAEERADFNATSALALGAQLQANADAYDADLETARSDRDRFAAARLAAAPCEQVPTPETPPVPGEVGRALTGSITPATAPMPANLEATMRALRRKSR